MTPVLHHLTQQPLTTCGYSNSTKITKTQNSQLLVTLVTFQGLGNHMQLAGTLYDSRPQALQDLRKPPGQSGYMAHQCPVPSTLSTHTVPGLPPHVCQPPITSSAPVLCFPSVCWHSF